MRSSRHLPLYKVYAFLCILILKDTCILESSSISYIIIFIIHIYSPISEKSLTFFLENNLNCNTFFPYYFDLESDKAHA